MADVVAIESGKRDKTSVDYSRGGEDHCGVCRFYIDPGKCRLVKGNIDPNYWCRLFRGLFAWG